jgi:RNA polymerase sigma-70 factor, ECF subfamily
VLADVHDMAYEQIAQVLEVPIGTVKSRVHRGRLALANVMGLDPRRLEHGLAGEPGGESRTSELEP